MKMNNIVTAIEINPSGIRLVTGYVYQEKVYVMEALIGDSIKVDANGFMDSKETEESIRVLLSTAKNALKCDLKNFIILLPPDEFQVKYASTTTVIMQETVQTQDFVNCNNMINKKAKETNLVCIYDDPVFFSTDNSSKSAIFPLGFKAENLSCEVDVHIISKVTFDYYAQIIKNLNIIPHLNLVSSFSLGKYLCSFKAPASFFTLYVDKDTCTLTLMKEKRISFSKVYDASYSQLVEFASRKLKITSERMDELIQTFGIMENETYPYRTEEGFNLSDIANAVKNSFSDFESIRNDMNTIDPSGLIPVSLFGSIRQIDGLDSALVNFFQRSAQQFSSKVYGARSDEFLPCLGAIRLTSNSYLTPFEEREVTKNRAETTFNGFSRG